MKTEAFRYFRLLLIAALIIAAAGIFPSSASAAPIVVLSNLGGATQAMSTGGFEAIGFTTPASPVYALTSATLEISYSCPVDAWLYTNNAGVPGTSLAAFTQISSGQVITLPQPYILSTSTSYWIVVGKSCGGSPTWNQKAVAPTGIFTYLGSAHSTTQVSPSWTVFFNYIFSLSAELVVPEVGLSDTSLSFGGQGIGTTSAAQTVTVTNDGLANLSIGTLGITGDFALSNDNCSGATVTPSNTCTFDVTFTPLSLGPLAGSVSIPSNAATTPDSVALDGTGLPSPMVGLSTTTINFGNQLVGVTSAPQTVTITNTGGSDLHIGVLGINSDFGLSNDTCSNATVIPTGTCTFDVIFQPLSLGYKSGQVSIPSDAASSPDIVDLDGTGVAVPDGVNLLKKPDFASASIFPTPWQLFGVRPPYGSVLSCTVFQLAPCSVSFGTGNRSAMQRVVRSGLAGDTYLFGLSSMSENAPIGGNYRVEVTFYNNYNRLVGSSSISFSPLTHGWETVSGYATATGNYNRIVFRFYYQNPSGRAWFDDAFLIVAP